MSFVYFRVLWPREIQIEKAWCNFFTTRLVEKKPASFETGGSSEITSDHSELKEKAPQDISKEV